jgi:hypothetical protein
MPDLKVVELVPRTSPVQSEIDKMSDEDLLEYMRAALSFVEVCSGSDDLRWMVEAISAIDPRIHTTIKELIVHRAAFYEMQPPDWIVSRS